jgi:hypothetical protein
VCFAFFSSKIFARYAPAVVRVVNDRSYNFFIVIAVLEVHTLVQRRRLDNLFIKMPLALPVLETGAVKGCFTH